MIPALSNLDLRVVQAAVQLTNQGETSRLLVYFGAELLIFIFPLVLLYLWQRPETAGRRHGAQKTVVLSLLAIVLTIALKSLISLIWVRDRPFVTDPALLNLPLPVDTISFPSGHTMLAFTVASCLWLSGYRKVGGYLIVAAVLVGLGRVLAGVHYPTDVMAGALLGFLVAWYLHRETSSLRRYLPDH